MSEQIADYWERRSDGGHRCTDEAWLEKNAMELLSLLPVRGVLLDVGCGAAEILVHLAKHFDRAIGMDISSSMLKAAEERVSESGGKNIELLRGHACRFPPSVAEADVIVSYGLAQYLEPKEIEEHIRECARILRPGGMIGICNIPWANLMDLYRMGGLHARPLPPTRALVRYVRCKVQQWLRDRGNVLADGIGFWHTHDDITRRAASAGFECEIVHSWFYGYRFHAVLSRPHSGGR